MKGKKSFWKLSSEETSFLKKFFAIFFIGYALVKLLPLGFLTGFVAGTEAFLLSSTGFKALAVGSLLIVEGQLFEIIAECTGLVLIVLLVALLYSTQVKEEKRESALLFFVPFLFLFNLVRLSFTFLAAVFFKEFFEAVHVLLWFIDSGLVLFLWSVAAGINLLKAK